MTDTKKTAKKTTATKKAAQKKTASKKVATKSTATKIVATKKNAAKTTATKPATKKKPTVAKKVATKTKEPTKKTVIKKTATKPATAKETTATKKKATKPAVAKKTTATKKVEAKKLAQKKSVKKVAKPKTPKKTKKALAVEKENAEISAMAAKIEAAAIKKMTKSEHAPIEIDVVEEPPLDDKHHEEIFSKPLVKKVKRAIKFKKVTSSSIKREKKIKKTTKRVKKLTVKQLRAYEDKLLDLKQSYQEQAKRLSKDSFDNNDVITVEDGTAAFDRQFALGLASLEGDILFEIDEALIRVKEKTYGVCEDCTAMIEEPRLNALAFARSCIKCQAKRERDAGIHYKPKM